MSDRLDQELRQALKEATARSLDGWEFSPQMRQAVHDRIAQEEARPTTPVAVPRKPQVLTRPITWMAAAAAVLVLSFSMVPKLEELSRGGSAKEASDSPGAVPMAAEPRLMALPQAKEASNEDREVAESPAQSDAAGAMLTAPEPAAEGISLQRSNLAVGDELKIETTDMMGNRVEPARTYLMAPTKIAAVPAKPEASAMGILSLTAAVTPVDLAPLPGGHVAFSSTASLQVLDEAGAVVVEESLTGGPERLFTAMDGRIGLLSGATLSFFASSGAPDGMLQLQEPPAAVALGPNRLVATLDRQGLTLYKDEAKVTQLVGMGQGSLAFAMDGTLAVMAEGKGTRTLQLLGQQGHELAKSSVSAGGQGLAFAANGQYVVAGSQVYHRSGQLVWQLPFQPMGVSALGPGGPVLAWDAHQISLLRAEDGLEAWTAEYQGGSLLQVTAATEGDQLAILGSAEEGEAVVWVLDREGGQRYAERLAAAPLRVAVTGATLHLLMPEGNEVRQLPEP